MRRTYERNESRPSRGWRWAVLLAGAVAACSSGRKAAPAPVLQSVAVSPAGMSYLAVSATQQLQATGQYADGSTGAITGGLTWSTSDPAVASVSPEGLVTAVGKGTATITARHDASGLAGAADLTAREVTVVDYGAAALPYPTRVESTAPRTFRLSGLTPGAFYRVDLGGLDDDVDLEIYADLSLSETALECASQQVGTVAEDCAAPASAAGELYVVADGQWTEAGSGLVLGAGAAAPVALQATLTFPGQLPFTSGVGTEARFYRVVGLTPGASYRLGLSQLTDDVDLEVYADPYEYLQLCASTSSGSADESCTAAASASGELIVEVDGQYSAGGSPFQLRISAAP